MSGRLKSAVPACLAGLCLLVSPILVWLGLAAAGAFLITASPPGPADAVIVLSGGGEERIEHAARVYKQSGARHFIITETKSSLPGSPRISSLDTNTALKSGVPGSAIYITRIDVEDTREEARAALDAANRFGIESLVVVTDPYHTRRASWIFSHIFPETVDIRLSPVAGHPYRSRDWFVRLEGWSQTLREYGGLAGFLIGYR